jgi:hypothetical protein
MTQLKKGMRVTFHHKGYLRSDTTVTRSKEGVIIGFIRHTKRYSGDSLVLVQLDGNKRASRIEQ